MAVQRQLRRGTKTENNNFTGAQGELTYTTDTKQVRIHDGSRVGGYNMLVLVAVQYPTAENGYTWYRKYSDGWVEQGGILTQSGDSSFSATIAFPIVMMDNNYNISFAGRGSNTGAGSYSGIQYMAETTTNVKVYVGNNGISYTKLCWTVSGMAA